MVDPVTIALTVVFWGSFGALLVCACCIVRYSMRWSHNAARNQRNSVAPGQHCQKNDTLHKKLIRQFKEGMKLLKLSGSQLQASSVSECSEGCSICIEDYTGPPQEVFIGYIKKCGHYFHFDCIWKWLEARATCPLCREKVQLTEEDIKGLALSQVPRSRSVQTMTDPEAVGVSSVHSQTEGHSVSILVEAVGRPALESAAEGTEGQRSIGSMTEDPPDYNLVTSESKHCSCGHSVSIAVGDGTVNAAFEDDHGEEVTSL